MMLCVFICYCRKALLLLKKKRYQDQLLEKTENQISNLERMVSFITSVHHALIFSAKGEWTSSILQYLTVSKITVSIICLLKCKLVQSWGVHCGLKFIWRVICDTILFCDYLWFVTIFHANPNQKIM